MHWRHEYTWAIFAAVMAALGFLYSAWTALGLVPNAWFCWIRGRRRGIGPKG